MALQKDSDEKEHRPKGNFAIQRSRGKRGGGYGHLEKVQNQGGKTQKKSFFFFADAIVYRAGV